MVNKSNSKYNIQNMPNIIAINTLYTDVKVKKLEVVDTRKNLVDFRTANCTKTRSQKFPFREPIPGGLISPIPPPGGRRDGAFFFWLLLFLRKKKSDTLPGGQPEK
ncbi:MAG: hypothetical protein ABUK01_03515 [Leptospirales bacterium]